MSTAVTCYIYKSQIYMAFFILDLESALTSGPSASPIKVGEYNSNLDEYGSSTGKSFPAVINDSEVFRLACLHYHNNNNTLM